MIRPGDVATAALAALRAALQWPVGDAEAPEGAQLPYLVLVPLPSSTIPREAHGWTAGMAHVHLQLVGVGSRRDQAALIADTALELLTAQHPTTRAHTIQLAGVGWDVIGRTVTLQGGIVDDRDLGIVNVAHRIVLLAA